MTAVDGDSTAESGEWGVFVARAVKDVRRDLGEAAASRVATLLHDFKSEAIGVAHEQLSTAERMLERAIDDVEKARRSHERLQADVARMNAAVREAKAEAARVRSDANDLATQREAESHARAQSEFLDREERANRRLLEIDAAEAELAALRSRIETEHQAGQSLDLRMEAIDLREVALDERKHELDQWEAEIVEQARVLDGRAGHAPSVPAAERSISGWGRRDRHDG